MKLAKLSWRHSVVSFGIHVVSRKENSTLHAASCCQPCLNSRDSKSTGACVGRTPRAIFVQVGASKSATVLQDEEWMTTLSGSAEFAGDHHTHESMKIRHRVSLPDHGQTVHAAGSVKTEVRSKCAAKLHPKAGGEAPLAQLES